MGGSQRVVMEDMLLTLNRFLRKSGVNLPLMVNVQRQVRDRLEQERPLSRSSRIVPADLLLPVLFGVSFSSCLCCAEAVPRPKS